MSYVQPIDVRYLDVGVKGNAGDGAISIAASAPNDGIGNADAEVQDAFARADLADVGVHGPAGTYLTTEPIPTLWDKPCTGPGIIKRMPSGNLHYLDPDPGDPGAIYVDPASGNDTTMDGLDPTQAFRTLQRAVNALSTRFPEGLVGNWTINCAAGDIGPCAIPDAFAIPGQLKILGAPVGGGQVGQRTQPITFVDGAVLPSGSRGFESGAAHNVSVRDILYKNFPTGQGCRNSRGILSLTNVHAYGCFLGIVCFGKQTIIKGGFVDGQSVPGCIGILGAFNAEINANNQDYDWTERLKVVGCINGLYVHEGVHVHCDYVWFENNVTNIGLLRASSINADGTRIWLGSFGVDRYAGATFLDNGCDFGEGTANANDVKIRAMGGEEFYSKNNDNYGTRTLYDVERRTDLVPVTGSIAETTVLTFHYQTPAGDVAGLASGHAVSNRLQVTLGGDATGDGAGGGLGTAATYKFYINDQLVASRVLPAGTLQYAEKFELHFAGENEQRTLFFGGQGAKYQRTTFDLRNGNPLVYKLTCTLGETGDFIVPRVVRLDYAL